MNDQPYQGVAVAMYASSVRHVPTSKFAVKLPVFILNSRTAVAAGEHWPRLLKDTGKVGRNIKVDWNKWVDEDEEDDKPDDFDMSQLQNMQQFGGGGGMGGMGGGMPGMPGMGDMNFEDLEGDAENINGAEDSDDELPPLEKET